MLDYEMYKETNRKLRHNDMESQKCRCPFKLHLYYLYTNVCSLIVVCRVHKHDLT